MGLAKMFAGVYPDTGPFKFRNLEKKTEKFKFGETYSPISWPSRSFYTSFINGWIYSPENLTWNLKETTLSKRKTNLFQGLLFRFQVKKTSRVCILFWIRSVGQLDSRIKGAGLKLRSELCVFFFFAPWIVAPLVILRRGKGREVIC